MTTDPSYNERPDPDRPGDRPGGEGGYGSDSYGGGSMPPAPPPPGYGDQGRPQVGEPRNGLGLAGLVCGIIAVALSLIPVLNVFTWPLGILAIVFGAIGWSRVNKGQATNKGQAITGLVLGIVSFFTFCLIYAVIGGGSSEYVDYNMAPFWMGPI